MTTAPTRTASTNALRKQSFDLVLRLRLKHVPGQLARVAETVAGAHALLGDITTVSLGEDESVRDITIEANDEAHAKTVVGALSGLRDVEVVSVTDPVFDAHRGGKIQVTSLSPIEHVRDLRIIYTPGVARVSVAIAEQRELAWRYTGISRTIGIFTNGTRVLGLGNVGPLASLPVMEGKAALYARFANLSAFPLVMAETHAQRFIETVERLSPSFGAIHLEDIRVPDCFEIEDALIARLKKPVMHDDQHGTATAALAALISASRLVGMPLRGATVGQIGLGAAGSAIARLALEYGVKEVLVHDVVAASIERMERYGAKATTLKDLLQHSDVVIAATGRPGLIDPKLLRGGQVVFALSNPEPEIDPRAALDAGARYASDGRTINNALAFPGIFRGALEVRAARITAEMLLAAADAIARAAPENELVPSPLTKAVHISVAGAVASRARELGLENTAEA